MEEIQELKTNNDAEELETQLETGQIEMEVNNVEQSEQLICKTQTTEK